MHPKILTKSNKIIKLFQLIDTLTHLNHNVKITNLQPSQVKTLLCFFLQLSCLYLLLIYPFILFSSMLLWLLTIKFITRCLHMATDTVPLCNGRRNLQVVAHSNDAVCSYDAAVSGPPLSAALSSHFCESQVCSLNYNVWLNNNEPFFPSIIEMIKVDSQSHRPNVHR